MSPHQFVSSVKLTKSETETINSALNEHDRLATLAGGFATPSDFQMVMRVRYPLAEKRDAALADFTENPTELGAAAIIDAELAIVAAERIADKIRGACSAAINALHGKVRPVLTATLERAAALATAHFDSKVESAAAAGLAAELETQRQGVLAAIANKSAEIDGDSLALAEIWFGSQLRK